MIELFAFCPRCGHSVERYFFGGPHDGRNLERTCIYCGWRGFIIDCVGKEEAEQLRNEADSYE